MTRIPVPRGLVLAGCLFLSACGGTESAGGEDGAAPPSIEIVDLAGVESALAAHHGQGVLLNFWAIWCAPCVTELPELLEVRDEFEADGGVVLGVSYDLMMPSAEPAATLERMRAFLADRDLAWPVLIYDDVDYDALNERYDLPGEIPVTLAFDRAGNLVDRQEGAAGKARFEEMMRRALGG